MPQARDCAPLGWSMWLLPMVVPALLSGVATASAQETGSITGVVADDTGAVLPGATVVVSSPALIEGSRTVFTDGVGQYRVIALRPGRYDVTVSLDGFSTVLREDIELSGTFTATVDVELSVGAREETVTVVAASPTVDVQTVQQQEVMTREVVDALPTGRVAGAWGLWFRPSSWTAVLSPTSAGRIWSGRDRGCQPTAARMTTTGCRSMDSTPVRRAAPGMPCGFRTSGPPTR